MPAQCNAPSSKLLAADTVVGLCLTSDEEDAVAPAVGSCHSGKTSLWWGRGRYVQLSHHLLIHIRGTAGKLTYDRNRHDLSPLRSHTALASRNASSVGRPVNCSLRLVALALLVAPSQTSVLASPLAPARSTLWRRRVSSVWVAITVASRCHRIVQPRPASNLSS